MKVLMTADRAHLLFGDGVVNMGKVPSKQELHAIYGANGDVHCIICSIRRECFLGYERPCQSGHLGGDLQPWQGTDEF